MKNISAQEIDRLFGEGTAALMQRQRQPVSMSERQEQTKAKIAQLKRTYITPDMVALSRNLLKSNLTQTFTTEETMVAPDAERVLRVFDNADRLQLKRENVQSLIEQIGFSEVETVLAVLAGQKSTKSLRDGLGFPVKYVTIDDVEQIVVKSKVTKAASAATNPLETFLGLPLKKR